jgi:hypothetical protein
MLIDRCVGARYAFLLASAIRLRAIGDPNVPGRMLVSPHRGMVARIESTAVVTGSRAELAAAASRPDGSEFRPVAAASKIVSNRFQWLAPLAGAI